ncbi:MAG: hypothetical protein ACE5I7_18930 [Candidatus Binatia bacterium]
MAKSSQKYAICVDNTDYPASLELRKIYRVVPDADAAQDGDLRVVDESGEDYLYPADFVIVDFPASALRALRKSFAREASEAR